jgi:hypothetical protein
MMLYMNMTAFTAKATPGFYGAVIVLLLTLCALK